MTGSTSTTQTPLVAGVAHLCVFWSFAAHPLVGLALLPLFIGATTTERRRSPTATGLGVVATVFVGLTVGAVVSTPVVLLLAAVVTAAPTVLDRVQPTGPAKPERHDAPLYGHGVPWESVQMIGL